MKSDVVTAWFELMLVHIELKVSKTVKTLFWFSSVVSHVLDKGDTSLRHSCAINSIDEKIVDEGVDSISTLLTAC